MRRPARTVVEKSEPDAAEWRMLQALLRDALAGACQHAPVQLHFHGYTVHACRTASASGAPRIAWSLEGPRLALRNVIDWQGPSDG